jgi:hypothetical protein
MGLSPGTVEEIKKYPKIFGNCFRDSLPPSSKIVTIIDDFHISVRNVAHKIKSYSEIPERMKKRIFERVTPDTKEYIISVDESEYVPKSKQPTQIARTGETFTDEEKSFIKIGIDPVFPHQLNYMSEDEFFRKFNSTRGIISEVQHFVCSSLLDINASDMRNANNLNITFNGFNYENTKRNGFIIHPNPFSPKKVIPPWKVGSEEEKPKTKTVIYKIDENRSISVYESDKIGEVDIKMIRDIFSHSQKYKGDVLIRTTDSDAIPILLLCMRDYISRESPNFTFNVYIEYPKKEDDERIFIYFDVIEAWRSIITYFSKCSPFFVCPIEAIVSLMLLGGSDYTDGLPGISPKELWEFCVGGGFNYLMCKINEYNTNTVENQPVEDIDAIITTSKNGFYERHAVKINQDKFYVFIVNLYFFKYRKFMTLPVDLTLFEILRKDINEKELNTYKEAMEKVAAKRNNGIKTRSPNRPKIIPNYSEIQSNLRRMWWTIDTWINGPKPIPEPIMDPLSVSKNKLSIMGWEQDPNGIVIKSRKVELYK